MLGAGTEGRLMSEQGAGIGRDDGTEVPRARVQVRADSYIYEGDVALLPVTGLLQEVLNDPRPFLNLTEVVIYDTLSQSTNQAPYVALNKGAITHVLLVPDEAVAEVPKAGESEIVEDGEGADSALVAAATTSPADAVEVPVAAPAGPKTMPAPPPMKRRADPPTQPFPALDEDVSDLILDDDDIDPADLLGASGEHVGGDVVE